MLVSGLNRAMCRVQPIWSASGTLPVDRNVVKKMPIWRMGPARWFGIRNTRPSAQPVAIVAMPSAGDPEREQADSPAGEVGAEGEAERRAPRRRVNVVRTKLAMIGPTNSPAREPGASSSRS